MSQTEPRPDGGAAGRDGKNGIPETEHSKDTAGEPRNQQIIGVELRRHQVEVLRRIDAEVAAGFRAAVEVKADPAAIEDAVWELASKTRKHVVETIAVSDDPLPTKEVKQVIADIIQNII